MSSGKRGTAVPWSFSSLQQYETCPRRFYFTRITKAIVEPQTEATRFGNEVHSALEKYVAGKAELPGNMVQYKPYADSVRNSAGDKLLEYKFGLTKDLKPTEFFAKNVWVRGVLDVCIIRDDEAVVLDWKTGKRKFDGDQLKLFAGVGLTLWPYVKSVKTGYVWLPDKKIDRETFTPEQKPVIFAEFAQRVRRMEESEKNDDWPARPSGLCKKWCPVGQSRCEHCGE